MSINNQPVQIYSFISWKVSLTLNTTKLGIRSIAKKIFPQIQIEFNLNIFHTIFSIFCNGSVSLPKFLWPYAVTCNEGNVAELFTVKHLTAILGFKRRKDEIIKGKNKTFTNGIRSRR